MGLNSTPSAERVHIGIFGKRNAGKSSIINAITDQSLAIVSDVKGTTTDPVSKAMELLPLGPVMIIDTPGLDDVGELGKMRIQKSYQVLNKTDIGILVVDGTLGTTSEDEALINRFKEKNIPYIVVMNKLDLVKEEQNISQEEMNKSPNTIWVSSTTKENIYDLKEMIAAQAPTDEPKFKIVGDLLNPSDFVVLVVPIDKAAPKGRLILPQQQTIRDILEAAKQAIQSPLLETAISGAKGILLNIASGGDLTLFEVSDASSLVTELCDPEANIIFGTSVRDDLDDNVMLTVIATDFE